MLKKAFIFDFDGTIADTIPNNKKIAELFNSFAENEHFSQRLTPEEVAAFREDHLFAAIKTLQIPLWKIPFILRKVRKIFKQDILLAEPVKDIQTTLEELKKTGVLLGIVSSTPEETIKEFLGNHRMEIFDFVHTANSLFGKDKTLKRLLKQYNIKASETIYIGDEIRDFDATKKVGIPMVAVTWGFNNKKGFLKYKPFQIIEKPQELLAKKFLE